MSSPLFVRTFLHLIVCCPISWQLLEFYLLCLTRPFLFLRFSLSFWFVFPLCRAGDKPNEASLEFLYSIFFFFFLSFLSFGTLSRCYFLFALKRWGASVRHSIRFYFQFRKFIFFVVAWIPNHKRRNAGGKTPLCLPELIS